MQESRYRLCCNRHVPSIRSFIYVLSDPGTLQRVAVSLEDVHVIADPLLDKYREERCGKAESEAINQKAFMRISDADGLKGGKGGGGVEGMET